MRKHSFGSMIVFGENNNNSICGLWMWRGHELAFTVCISSHLSSLSCCLKSYNNNNLGRRISTVSGDIHESSYLFQCIAVTIQRFNSALFHDSFLPSNDF